MKKVKDNLVNLVKVEDSIATLFEELLSLEIKNSSESIEYKKYIHLLNELLNIEKRYLTDIYDYVSYTDNTFFNNTVRYVVSEFESNSKFINQYYEDTFEEDTLSQRKKFINISDNIYKDYLDSIFVSSKNKVDNINEDIEFDNENDIRISNNLIYQRIMYSLNALQYYNLKEEIMRGDFCNENALANLCITRDSNYLFIKEMENFINKKENSTLSINNIIINSCKYYKYIDIFTCSLLTEDYFFNKRNHLLKSELYRAFQNNSYVDNLYIENGNLDIDVFLKDIYTCIEDFTDSMVKTNYNDTVLNIILIVQRIKADLYLLMDKQKINNYCSSIYRELLNNNDCDISNSKMFVDYLKKELDEILNNTTINDVQKRK